MSKEAKVLQAVAVNFDGCYKKKNRSRILDIKRETVYNDIINRIGNNIFKWEGLPKEFRKSCSSMLIELAVNCGVAAIYKVPDGISPVNSGKWTCTPIEWTGQLMNDGTAAEAQYTKNGSEIKPKKAAKGKKGTTIMPSPLDVA